jgi:alcohol dehydrogenase class IV
MWFFRSPEIVFGEFALEHLTSIQGKRALIITDPNIVRFGFVEIVKAKLAEAGIESAVFAEVEPEPSLQTVRRGAEEALAFEPDWIVGLGGGSCLDAAKAAWFLYERPDLDPAEISPFGNFGLRAKARLISIPTTSGTGSEATFATVLTDMQDGRKLGLQARELVSDLAIVDPSFVMELPPQLTADTGIDVLTHAVEGYTSTYCNDFSDGLCLKAIQLAFDYLPRAYENGAGDPEAREAMHNAAAIAGLGFGNSMAALAHAMGHALGAVFHTPHGRAVGLFLPYTIEFTANGGEGRYSDIARFLGLPAKDPAEGVASLVAAIRELQQRIGQPHSGRELGISFESYAAGIPRMISNVEMDTSLVFSARMPDSEELEQLYRYAYEGKAIDF